jgi:hypothetical protein
LFEPSVSADFEPKRSTSSLPGDSFPGADGEQVEVEDVKPLLDEREVRPAVFKVNSQPAERLGVNRGDLFAGAVQVFEGERLARCVAERAVPIGPPRLRQ